MPRPRVGRAVTTVEPTRRTLILRELWLADAGCDVIAERLGLAASSISALARRAGLPPRHRRGEVGQA